MLFHLIPIGNAPPNPPPLIVRYWDFLRDLVLHASLGAGFFGGRRITQQVIQAAPITAAVVVGGAFLWVLVSTVLGVLTALRPRSLFDRGVLVFALLSISAPPVWFALVLSYVIGFRLHWTPIAGYCEAFTPPPGSLCGGVHAWFTHLILPWISFALVFIAFYTRLMRSNVMEELQQDYVRTARAKGASEGRILSRHVSRNVALTLVTMVGMDFGIALGGAAWTEVVFGLPGLGETIYLSVQTENWPVVQGIVIFTSLCVIAVNLLVDLLYAVVDPRVRVAATFAAA
ncbi:MAG TPA: ABC transporter permease [Gaiellaceae bacterium]|nr:ABC transporter permease [Gaiellaceae bacterium]